MFRLQRASALVENVSSHVHKLSVRRNLQTTVRRWKDAGAEETIAGIPYKNLSIGVPKETFLNEKRVSTVPATVAAFTKKGFTVNVEENAGVEAKFLNDVYAEAGANIVNTAGAMQSDIVLKVRAPANEEINLLRDNGTLLSFLYPAQNQALIDELAKKNMTIFGMDCVPRISRAQVFDALSSMANIAGYKAVVEAANNFGRFFTGKSSHNESGILPGGYFRGYYSGTLLFFF